MKTYSETEQAGTFDWFEFLTKDTFTPNEIEEAASKAGSWVTCACGNQCDVIPRNRWGEPCDFDLKILGSDFAKALDNMNLNWFGHFFFETNRLWAITLLVAIEHRSAELIYEIKAKQPL